jgi:hypothetical protein
MRNAPGPVRIVGGRGGSETMPREHRAPRPLPPTERFTRTEQRLAAVRASTDAARRERRQRMEAVIAALARARTVHGGR